MPPQVVVDIHVIQYITSYRAAHSSKAAIGYSYGEEVVRDYSDNDSDQESVHEVEGEPPV